MQHQVYITAQDTEQAVAGPIFVLVHVMVHAIARVMVLEVGDKKRFSFCLFTPALENNIIC
jgi:hypothetical protein